MEFDWICGSSSFYQSFFSQVQFSGVLAGTLLFGTLSDRFGRKPIGIIVFSIAISATFTSGMAPTVNILFVLRFFVGLSIGGSMVVICAWVIELILPQQRMVVRGSFNWGWSRVAITTICYFTRDWRLATYTFSISMIVPLLLAIFILPESPIWFHSRGFKEKMIESERRIAGIAGIPYVPIQHKSIRPKTLMETIKTKGMFRKLRTLWIMWFIGAMCGTAIDLNSGNLAGDLYMNQFSFGILLVFSKILLLFVDTHFSSFNRRTLHQGSLIGIITCFVILTGFVTTNYHGVGVLIMYLIGTVFIEYTWDACYLCAIELMETSSRASATGSCSLAARAGKILAPILIHANLYWPYAVNMSIIFLGTINLLVSYFLLPESKGVNLDEVYVEDEEHLDEDIPMLDLAKH